MQVRSFHCVSFVTYLIHSLVHSTNNSVRLPGATLMPSFEADISFMSFPPQLHPYMYLSIPPAAHPYINSLLLDAVFASILPSVHSLPFREEVRGRHGTKITQSFLSRMLKGGMHVPCYKTGLWAQKPSGARRGSSLARGAGAPSEACS